MRYSWSLLAAFLALGFALAPSAARSQSAPIFLDGFFDDWTGPVELVDPAGDGVPGGVDFRDVDLANDDDYLFLRFDLTVEVSLQETNNLVLYLDTDQNAATGTPISGIGAELRWRFGARQGTFYTGGSSSTVYQDDLRLRQLPSVTSSVFEIAIGRDVRPNGSTLLFTGSGMRILLRHEVSGGDQAPDAGTTLTYVFDGTPVAPPTPIPLARQNAGDLRITTWNVVDLEQNGGGWNSSVTPSADRVLSALEPDILCFEEIYDNSAAATAALIESFLPSGPGEAWYARENSDVKIVSRFPVLGSWTLNGTSGDRNLAVLLDTQAAIGRQLLVVGAHFFCCTNDSGRQAECDRIMSFIRDAKSPGGSVTVPEGTMLLVTGDLNLVGDSQQLTTLLTGDIVDEGTFGPDFGPDWDGSPLTDLVSSQTEKRFAYTWRNDFGSYAPGRLDYFIYSDSVVTVGNHMIVYTPEMSGSALAQYGMQAGDVTTVSDHLPHTADFRERVSTDVAGDRNLQRNPRWATVGVAWASPGRARLQLVLERTAHASVAIYDVRGARVAILRGDAEAALGPGTHRLVWDGRIASGAVAASGTYIARLVARDAAGNVLVTSTKLTFVR